jgi:hypothetical protein
MKVKPHIHPDEVYYSAMHDLQNQGNHPFYKQAILDAL